jgi:hypothetical protein
MATPTNLPATFVAGNILTAAQQNALRGAFRVLQVVTSTTTTAVSSSSTTYADVGLSATITPQSATNKILVMMTSSCQKSAGNANSGVFLQMLRGATNIASYSFGLFTGTAMQNVGSLDLTIFDSPATTSATTYKVQMKNNVAVAEVEFSTQSNPCTLVLMEISA